MAVGWTVGLGVLNFPTPRGLIVGVPVGLLEGVVDGEDDGLVLGCAPG